MDKFISDTRVIFYICNYYYCYSSTQNSKVWVNEETLSSHTSLHHKLDYISHYTLDYISNPTKQNDDKEKNNKKINK
jgi:hypothetical protein